MNFAIFLALLQVTISGGILFDGKSEHSLVLSNRDLAENQIDSKIREKRATDVLELLQFKVEAKIRYRYSQTHVTSHVRNTDYRNGQEVRFQVILPETAFISNFFMEIDRKLYEAYVKEKEEAKAEYDLAKVRGQSAGLLELNARHANVFNVNVNIKAGSIIWFNLTYEELLSRRFGRYEQIITLNGDEISKNSDVQLMVDIEESQDLVNVKALNLQNELEATDNANSDANINMLSPNYARITWSPKSKTDVLKRFIVQYDVERELDSGQVLIMNGYFVHFFAPPKLKPLQKHVVFVLDVSGSMSGRKIEQLKEAMREILKDLNSNDYLNMIIFSDSVTMWMPGDRYTYNYMRSNPLERQGLIRPFPASLWNIQEAKYYIDSLTANGGTNINDALIEALNLTARVRRARDNQHKRVDRSALRVVPLPIFEDVLPPRAESMILFLTDGEPTTGETNLETIQKNIRLANLGLSVPIFSLAFGAGADFTLLRKISLQNHAFARKIYEAADAALQLQGFYSEISSPLLSNVEFNYTSPETPYAVSDITRRKFPTFYKGWELAVAGKIEPSKSKFSPAGDVAPQPMPEPSGKIAHTSLIRYPPTDHCHFYSSISGMGYDGEYHWHRPLIYMPHPPWWCYPHPHWPITTTTTLRPPTAEETFLERLWAYLTIQNLIEKDLSGTSSTGETPKQQALRLALQYKFVTAQTSLVVVKPESIDFANPESVDRPRGGSIAGAMSPTTGGMHFTKMHAPMMMNGGAGPRPMASMDMDEEADNGGSSPNGGIPYPTKKMKTTTPRAPVLLYTLKDLTWLKGDKITITKDGATAEYRVVKPGKQLPVATDAGRECVIGKSMSSKLSKLTGNCDHLRNCVRQEFLDDFEAYKENYFCPIRTKGSSELFAGTCCV